MKTYFVVCTPFQRYVVEELTSQFKIENSICFDFTRQKKLKQQQQTNFDEICHIRYNLNGFKKIWSFRKEINSFIKKKENITFFIPHAQHFLTSYLYRLSLNNSNFRIKVFYEGASIFIDDYSAHAAKKTILKRKLLGAMSGFPYKHFNQLYPRGLRSISEVYTPLKSFTTHFSQKTEFKFSHSAKSFSQNSTQLILGSSIKNRSNIDELFEGIKNVINATGKSKPFLFKPHYTSTQQGLSDLNKKIKEQNLNCKILINDSPIEDLISELKLKSIYALHPTSALINLRLKYGDALELYIYPGENKNPLEQIFKHLNIQLL